jgi:hypothetical protein
VFIAFGVLQNYAGYWSVRSAHQDLQQRIDQGEANPLTTQGFGLAEMYEERVLATADHLFVLELALQVGVLPSFLLMFAALFVRGSAADAQHIKNSETSGVEP